MPFEFLRRSLEQHTDAERLSALPDRAENLAIKTALPNTVIYNAGKKPHIYERRKKFPTYTSKKPSLEMLVYELLGIRIYRPIWEMYMTPFWWSGGDDVRDIFTTSTDPEKHKRFRRFMISHATIHVLGFVAFLFIFNATTFALLMNVFVNVYPLMLQRYNWLRMKRAGLI